MENTYSIRTTSLADHGWFISFFLMLFFSILCFPDALSEADMMIIVADIISLGSVLVELVIEVVAIV